MFSVCSNVAFVARGKVRAVGSGIWLTPQVVVVVSVRWVRLYFSETVPVIVTRSPGATVAACGVAMNSASDVVGSLSGVP